MATDETKEEIKIEKKDFFFAGGLVYKPQNVIASTRSEAEEIWEKTKEPVTPQKAIKNNS